MVDFQVVSMIYFVLISVPLWARSEKSINHIRQGVEYMSQRTHQLTAVTVTFLILTAFVAQANAQLPTVPFSTEGNIGSASGTKTIDFVYGTGGPLTVSVGDFGGALDPAMTLIAPDGRQYRDDDGGPGDDAVVYFTAAAPAPMGQYRLIVNSQSGTMGRFSVNAVPVAIDQPGAASMIGFGERVQRRLANHAQVHVFYFYANVGDYIEVYLSDYTGYQASALDPFLTLTGPEGFAPVTDDDSGPEDDALIVVGPATIGGLYTILVGASPGTMGAGQYLLVLASNRAVSRPIAPGETVNGSIQVTGKIDSYTFMNPTGAEVTFLLDDLGSSLDPFLTLRVPDQMDITDDNSGPNDDAYITTEAMAGTVIVSGGPWKTIGSYALTYQVGPYILPELKPGTTGTYIFPWEPEVFVFAGTAGQRVTITVGDGGGPLNPAFILYGPTGNVVAEGLKAFEDDDDVQISQFALPATGTYTLYVFGQEDMYHNPTFGRAIIGFVKM